MLNMIGGGGAGSIATGMLSQGPETWNPALYQLAVNVHDVAVKPLTSVVLAVVFTLELARNSTRIESDRELGVKIVAGTLFKVALVFLAVQNGIVPACVRFGHPIPHAGCFLAIVVRYGRRWRSAGRSDAGTGQGRRHDGAGGAVLSVGDSVAGLAARGGGVHRGAVHQVHRIVCPDRVPVVAVRLAGA